jgi:hypothetical protein
MKEPLIASPDVKERAASWRTPVLIICFILALVGASLRWSSLDQYYFWRTITRDAEAYMIALMFFVPLLCMISHFLDRAHAWLVAFGIFWMVSPLLVHDADNLHAVRDKDRDVKKSLAGVILLLIGSGIALFCVPFTPKLSASSTPILGIASFILALNLIGCCLFWDLERKIEGTNYLDYGLRNAYLGVAFLLAALGSRAGQILTPFLAGLQLMVLAESFNWDSDVDAYADQRRAAAVFCWLSAVLMIIFIIFFAARKEDEGDDNPLK